MVTVWGLAAGRRSTKDAAPGAFTWREYPTLQAAREAEPDWRVIITRAIAEGSAMMMGRRTSCSPLMTARLLRSHPAERSLGRIRIDVDRKPAQKAPSEDEPREKGLPG